MISLNDSFKMPYDWLHEEKIGDYKIEKFSISENNFLAMIQGVPIGNYVRLKYCGEIVMSNTPMEIRTNIPIMCNGYGDILIVGLGIGCILGCLDSNDKVNSVTVLERSEEVIQLNHLEGRFSDKVKVIHADAWEWKRKRNDLKYDCIWLDIWNYINKDVYEEMKTLKAKYRPCLKDKKDSPNRFITCWAEHEARYGLRLR